MSTKSKPWTKLEKSRATCDACGGVSVWLPEIRFGGKLLTYWRWWQGFKKRHAKCRCGGMADTLA